MSATAKISKPPELKRSLTSSWQLGPLQIENRVLLAPLAGIGNWFVRLQAKRHGAGLVFSEMVSSFGVHYGNERTCQEMLRIEADEHPVAVQLFGYDPEVMASAAARVAEAGADVIDINMGCPVPKVCKTGAGAALLKDHDRAVALALAAGNGGLPVTVKLRSGRLPGDEAGLQLAHRLATEGKVAAITFHPRHASQQHRGKPDYGLARELVSELQIPVILSGGMQEPETVVEAFEFTGAEAVMLARGSLGNPWLFEKLLGRRDRDPDAAEIVAELRWVISQAEEHFGTERAGRYLRKFYPWYLAQLGADRKVQDSFQRLDSLEKVSEMLKEIGT